MKQPNGENAGLIKRLREQGTLAVCPYDRRSPDYWTAPNDKPCPMCGGEPEGPDKCTGADLRIMEEAADALAKADERERELEKVREALEPFRNAAAAIDDQWSDEYPMMGTREFSDKPAVVVTIGDLRRVRAVLEGKG